ncbi:hypothetical protein CFOL_v3_35102, partial [Cephalotus follicularis]
NLQKHTCTCYRWQLTGIPYAHGIAVIQDLRAKLAWDFVDPFYHKETYLRAYTPLIQPINGKDKWPKSLRTPPMPPVQKKQSGRAKVKRIMDPSEPANPYKLKRKHQPYKCTRCGSLGHNKKSFPGEVPVSDRATQRRTTTQKKRVHNLLFTSNLLFAFNYSFSSFIIYYPVLLILQRTKLCMGFSVPIDVSDMDYSLFIMFYITY